MMSRRLSVSNTVRQRFVLAYLAGPPCETWSKAREVAAEKVGDRRNYGANRA